jgi:cytidylate kinase
MPQPPVEQPAEQADPAHLAAVLAVAADAVPVAGTTVVVAIDGRSGSGKTVLGTAVAQALGCPIVHLDDVFPGWDGLAAGVALVTEQVLAPLARNERAAYQRWDWMRSQPGRTVDVDAGRHLVLEGCGALVPPAAPYAAVRVWVDAPDAVRQRRALGRDGDVYAPHWQRWAAQEESVYAAAHPWQQAHLVLSTATR